MVELTVARIVGVLETLVLETVGMVHADVALTVGAILVATRVPDTLVGAIVAETQVGMGDRVRLI